MRKGLIVFGFRSTATEIAELARSCLSGVFERVETIRYQAGFPAGDPLNALLADREWHWNYIIGFHDYELRTSCVRDAESRGLEAGSVISPDAFVSSSAQVGHGCYIAPGAVVSFGARLHNHVCVNYHASIGHGATLGSHCLILPGARVSGDAHLEEGVLLGSNAVVLQGKHVGRTTRIDALTYIYVDVPAGCLCTARKTQVVRQVVLGGGSSPT